jgi:hypothetical protein
MNCRINRPVLDVGTRWILTEEVITFPVLRGSDWSRNKTAAAVRADVSQNAIDTSCTKRAFIRANAGFKGVWRQRFIAVFAGGSEFEHDVLFLRRECF